MYIRHFLSRKAVSRHSSLSVSYAGLPSSSGITCISIITVQPRMQSIVSNFSSLPSTTALSLLLCPSSAYSIYRTLPLSSLVNTPFPSIPLSYHHYRYFATRSELAARKTINQNSQQFIQTVTNLFTNIERACKDGNMIEKNPGFSIKIESLSPTRLQCIINAGHHSPDNQWIIESDNEQFRISMSSTKIAGSSGILYYTYDINTGQWINTKDKHFLIELLTRDLIHICKGFPNF